MHLAILCCLYLTLAQSFNLVFGVGKIFNLSHISAYAVGAYTTALLSTRTGFEVWSCLVCSICIGAVFSVIVSAVSARLKEDYLAIGTLALHSVVIALLTNWKSFTNGVLGIPGIPRPLLFGSELQDSTSFFIFTLSLSLLALGVLICLFRSPFARALRAQAESQIAAQSLGVSLPYCRSIALLASSAIAALSGGIFAYYLNYIDPSSFGLSEMVLILAIVTLGTPGSFRGVIFASLFLVLLPESLRFIDLPSSILGPARQLLYAIVLFFAVYLRREKIFAARRVI